jgi:uncharacterized protein YeaO (DUF488 family)
MPIKTKRWNDPAEPDDGLRLLICRYRPRGLPRADETWDAWNPDLAPSKQLLADFHGKGRIPTSWTEYRTRYRREMLKQQPAIDELARRSTAGQTITLLCSAACDRESRCHRSLLKQLIERAMLLKATVP